jgi:hypothetical protein
MTTIIHFQCSKGVLVLDSSGLLSLSIPANATCHSYDHGHERSPAINDSAARQRSFPYKGAGGMLAYKQGSTLQSIVVTAHDKPEIRSEKTLRFTLEANSLVPSGMTPGKYTNIAEVSLNLTSAMERPQRSREVALPEVTEEPITLEPAMLPPASTLSKDPVQLLQQLTARGGAVAPPVKKKGCCEVQVSTFDPMRGVTLNWSNGSARPRIACSRHQWRVRCRLGSDQWARERLVPR